MPEHGPLSQLPQAGRRPSAIEGEPEQRARPPGRGGEGAPRRVRFGPAAGKSAGLTARTPTPAGRSGVGRERGRRGTRAREARPMGRWGRQLPDRRRQEVQRRCRAVPQSRAAGETPGPISGDRQVRIPPWLWLGQSMKISSPPPCCPTRRCRQTLSRWSLLQPEPGEALHSPPDVLRDGWEQPLGQDIRRSGKEPQGAVGMKPPRQDGGPSPDGVPGGEAFRSTKL